MNDIKCTFVKRRTISSTIPSKIKRNNIPPRVMARNVFKGLVNAQRNEISRLRRHIKTWALKLLNDNKITQREFRAIMQERDK